MSDSPTSPRSPRRPENVLLAGMLQDARLKAGLTQVEVANRLGMAQTFVSKIEVLERKIELVVVRDLCRIYGVDFRDFIEAFESGLSKGKAKPATRLIRKDKGTRRR